MRNERLSNNKKSINKKKTRRHFDKSIPLGFLNFFQFQSLVTIRFLFHF